MTPKQVSHCNTYMVEGTFTDISSSGCVVVEACFGPTFNHNYNLFHLHPTTRVVEEWIVPQWSYILLVQFMDMETTNTNFLLVDNFFKSKRLVQTIISHALPYLKFQS